MMTLNNMEQTKTQIQDVICLVKSPNCLTAFGLAKEVS